MQREECGNDDDEESDRKWSDEMNAAVEMMRKAVGWVNGTKESENEKKKKEKNQKWKKVVAKYLDEKVI